jgi:hypothetical protein
MSPREITENAAASAAPSLTNAEIERVQAILARSMAGSEL